MVSTRRPLAGGKPTATSAVAGIKNKKNNIKSKKNAGKTARKETRGSPPGPDYEKFREQRIRENQERMQKLGILDLSLKLKSQLARPKKTPRNVSSTVNNTSLPQRRSSRLKVLAPVNYSGARHKEEKLFKKVEIQLPKGCQPEVYTEEHEKLLGDCETEWALSVDGFGEDGKRIYDPVNGESCHQCRQKTLGLHTHCSKCNLVQGQFCGDCLYMRYGENVIEVNKNPEWICPVCRGICNCSMCRKAKGWAPTGNVYRKVISLGFKSVSHYLIQTHRSKTLLEYSAADMLISEEKVAPSLDTGSNRTEDESLISDENSDILYDIQSDDHENEMGEEDKQVHSFDNSKLGAIKGGCSTSNNNCPNNMEDENIKEETGNMGLQEANESSV